MRTSMGYLDDLRKKFEEFMDKMDDEQFKTGGSNNG